MGRLASRLHEEADTRLNELTTKHRSEVAKLNEILGSLQEELKALQTQHQAAQTELADERHEHQETRAQLRAETLEKTRLAQQVSDFQDRFAQEKSRRESLEEKHLHAREALEHFRLAAKEQREQEQRQHDQQIQYLQGEVRSLNASLAEKQHEAIHSNQENARLCSELARAEATAHQAQSELCGLKGVKEELEATRRRVAELERRAVEQDDANAELTATKRALEIELVAQQNRAQQLEVELAAIKASSATEGALAEQIRAIVSASTADAIKETKGRKKG